MSEVQDQLEVVREQRDDAWRALLNHQESRYALEVMVDEAEAFITTARRFLAAPVVAGQGDNQ